MATADAGGDAARRRSVLPESRKSVLTTSSTAAMPAAWSRAASRLATALVVAVLTCVACSGPETIFTGGSGAGAQGSQAAPRDAALAGSAAEHDDAPATDRIAALRASLAAHVHGYAKSLADVDPAGAPSAIDRVADLRGQLSREAALALDAATSSEAVTAVRRAELESTLEAIHAYERAFGAAQHELTTEWSVLPDADLQALRASARADLAALERVTHRYSDAERPASLERRRSELARWGESLEAEAAARAQGRAPASQIRSDLSLAEARRIPEIAAAEQRGLVFEAKLRMQVALRSHWAPGDAGLANLARRPAPAPAPAGGAAADSVFQRVKAQRAARPPPVEATAPRGPPARQDELRALDVAEDVRAATWDEIHALRAGDPVAAAKALARQRTGMSWLKTAFGNDGFAPNRLSTHSTASLRTLRGEYEAWYRDLAGADAANPDALQHPVEASEARATLGEIDAEIAQRSLPSHTARNPFVPEDLASSRIAPERSPALAALDRRWQAALSHEEAVQLEVELNRPRTVPNTRLGLAEQDAAARSLIADAEALHDAWSELEEQGRRILIGERGTEATAHAQRVAEARVAVAEASGRISTDLDRLPSRASPAARAARAKLAGLRAPGATPARTTVAAALAKVEGLPPRLPGGASQPPAIAFLQDAGSSPPSHPEPPPGPRGSPPAAGLPEIEYVAPSPSMAPRGAPESYSELFPEREAWTRSQRGAIEPRRAPGGIVIDAVLPEALARRTEAVTIDPGTGAIRVRIDGRWHRFEPAVDVAAARAAWGFVRDGRVPAADVRPLALPEVAWLAPLYSGLPLHQLTPSEQRGLREELRDLTSVNLNPALVATSIGVDLMFADLVIFDLLPASEIAVEGDTRRFGIDVGALWHAFWTDRERQRTDPELGQQPFRKSLLVIRQCSARLVGQVLAASVVVEPSIFTMPLEGSHTEPRAMADTTRWLADHTGQIRAHVPSFERLARFAATTALFKTVEQRQIPNDLDLLTGVATRPFTTPRVFCRSTDALRCDRNRFARHTEHHDSH